MNEILTTAQVCAYLNISRKTLATLRKKGVAPKSFQVGDSARSNYRYLKTDVDQWIDEKRSA